MPNISLSWLGDHVDLPENATLEEVAADLVRVGIEEEELHPAAVTGPLVAGKVLSYNVEEHKNGKAIRYCRVDVGAFNDEPGEGAEVSDVPSRGIVCGAHNFEVGDTVVVCLPGAVLPGPFPIAARKTYGHVSDGMIVSERELGLGDDHDGIIVLDKNISREDLPVPGSDMIMPLGLGEEVLEVNVTPDRGYCFAVRGLAREYAHSTGVKFADSGLPNALQNPLPTSSEGAFEVVVPENKALEGRAACDRFVTRIVRGLDPQAKAPQWMRSRLEQAGMRSVSLPVDVTNYVMLDLGQPLHAYDLREVAAPFVVRRAAAAETFTTLDGVVRRLNEEDLVISDSPGGEKGSRIVGLAGVMGGLNSEVQPDTTDVVIEAAHFDALSVARTSRRHRLYSEASKRFERGVDPLLPPVAAARVAELLAKYGGGTIDQTGYDLFTWEGFSPVSMKLSEPRRLTGVDYPEDRIVELLVEIGCTVDKNGDYLLVTPPSWRPDLVGPAHLVEEIARLDGYDNIPSCLPAGPGSAGLAPDQLLRRRVAEVLAHGGFVEVKSYPFIGTAHDRQMFAADDERRMAAKLRNPLADDAPLLRTSLLDTLLETAERNASRGIAPLALFEVGQVTKPQGTVVAPIFGVEKKPDDSQLKQLYKGVPAQPWHVAGVMGGKFAPRSGPELESGNLPAISWGWADAIEAVRALASANGVKVEATRTWVPETTKKRPGAPLPQAVSEVALTAPFHPGRCATLFVRTGKGFRVIGRAGELHPKVIKEYGLVPHSAAFEVDADALVAVTNSDFIQVKPVSTYPVVKEDFAIVVDENIPVQEVEMTIKRAVGPLLEGLVLFDIYRGSQVPDGHRSLAYALTLRDRTHTLSPKEVDEVRGKVVSQLEKRLGATLRA